MKQKNQNVWHARNTLLNRTKHDEYWTQSRWTNLDNVIFLLREQVLLLLVPADACSNNTTEHVLVSTDTWQAGLHLRQDHIVCC